MMGDELLALQAAADKIEVCYFEDESNTDDERDEFRSFLNEEIEIPFLTYVQRGEDIWEKMANAFKDSFDCEPGPKILVGCDIPQLSKVVVDQAFLCLESNDYVVNPTKDGGYYLIGMNKLQPELFALKNNIEKNGKDVLTDVDEPHDLLNLQGSSAHVILREHSDRRIYSDDNRFFASLRMTDTASLTESFIKTLDFVSVIVPVYNEISTINDCMNRLQNVNAEVLYVDGGSTDGTQDYIRLHGGTLIESEKGRANQMNLGAKLARSNKLFFLHADSIPPKNFEEEIQKTLNKTNWGCFGIKFDTHEPLMKICQIISNNRIHDRKVVFGDQGIFIKRSLFEEIGGFPNLPIMEDYQFSLTLKEKGEKIGVAKGLITTSARRYEKGKKLSVMWKMNRLRKQYRDGVDINEIAAQYKDIR